MGIFSRDKEKGKLILVFDIGSSSVGGALFYADRLGIPKIIVSFREPIILQKNFNIDRFLSSMIKSLRIVVGRIFRAGAGKPEAIFCVLSSSWHASQTRIIRLEKNSPFIFTSKLALDLIQKEITSFEEEYKKKYANEKSSVRSIEFKNIKTVLNGYESPFPLGQKAKELEMTIFISVSPEQVLKKIEETIGKCFHFKDIKFSSFTLASFAVVRDIYAHRENFLLIDIGGEVTEISMVKKNILHESISFPLGYNFIMREIASALSCPVPLARSLFSLSKDGHATESVANKIGLVVGKLRTEWLRKFQESLANLSNDISVPSVIYLSIDREMADFFSTIIKTEQFNQYTLTESKFEIIPLSAEVFHGMTVFKNDINRDPGLIIVSIFINRFLINSAQTGQI